MWAFMGFDTLRWRDLGRIARASRAVLGRFAFSRRGNIATIFALSLVPMAVAAGAGVDIARSMVVRTRLSEALDAAALAVGSTTGLSQADATALAQKYFNANYTVDPAFGTPSAVSVSLGTDTATVSTNVPMPTTWIGVVGIKTVNVTSSSTVVWGQTKLWVSLALDNTGSMSETDKTGTSKMSALKTATHQLLTTLQSAASNPGDVKVAIVPFSKDVNLGTTYKNSSWIDWTDWESAPANGTPGSDVGPGSPCPYSTWSNGYSCQTTPTNGSSSTGTIPSSGTYSGYICPTVDNGNANSGRSGRYYNGCYNSTAHSSSQNGSCNGYGCSCPSGSSNCHCSGSFSRSCTWTTTVTTYTHSWVVNSHSTWGGCIMDRTQDYDTLNTTPTNTSTDFPAENAQSCVPSKLGTLSYDWTSLSNQVDAMTAGGNTNQTIGLAWAWQALTDGNPLNAGTLPSETKQVIIILSDGLNTQNRWTSTQSSIDTREGDVCTNAKQAGIIVYAVYVDLNGTSGNSAALQSCATDDDHYFDLTTSGAIVTAFNTIAEQITNLRVSR